MKPKVKLFTQGFGLILEAMKRQNMPIGRTDMPAIVSMVKVYFPELSKARVVIGKGASQVLFDGTLDELLEGPNEKLLTGEIWIDDKPNAVKLA